MNGTVTISGRRVGSIATYSCNAGFTLSGASTRECTDAGNWTGQAPFCIDNQCKFAISVVRFTRCSHYSFSSAAVDCGRPRVSANGRLFVTTTTLGSVARYSCNLPYRVEGERMRRCLVNGSWSGSVPTCVCKQFNFVCACMCVMFCVYYFVCLFLSFLYSD